MSEYDALLDPTLQAIDRERSRKQAAETQAAGDEAARKARSKEAKECGEFITRHRNAGWPIATSSDDTLTSWGTPTLETSTGARVNLGRIYEWRGRLYHQDGRYPLGLDRTRYYQPEVGRVIWWDGDRSLRMFQLIDDTHEAATRKWHAARHPQPDTQQRGRGRRGRKDAS